MLRNVKGPHTAGEHSVATATRRQKEKEGRGESYRQTDRNMGH